MSRLAFLVLEFARVGRSDCYHGYGFLEYHRRSEASRVSICARFLVSEMSLNLRLP